MSKKSWYMLKVIVCFGVLLNCSVLNAQTTKHTPFSQQLTAKQAHSDMEQWFDWLHQTHPDLTHSIKNVDVFYDEYARIKASIVEPLSALALWQKMAPLNSILADGHIKVGHGSSKQWRQWITEGTALFPFEIDIKDGSLFIVRDLSEESSEYKGARIESVNGERATSILNKLLVNTHGDTPQFRGHVLQSQFNRLFFMTYGPHQTFDIELFHKAETQKITVNAKAAIPTHLKKHTFEEVFNVTYDAETALLTLNTFAWDDITQFLQFMDSTFAEIRRRNIGHLIIDIRNNGGGNDDMWMAGILRYIADKPYRHFSFYESKILLKYRDPGQLVGNIERGENTRRIQPELKLENFFRGRTTVLIDTGTYSSSIVFANTLQDYGFAQLVGNPTGGRSTQSGGIQFTQLAHSGLQMISPRFLLIRPSGAKQMTPVVPDFGYCDIELPDVVQQCI
ncbi:hypothetical protein KUC3_34480 [Alteromonas sp. KC3]|uniref:S41 family peptidase n=1 Tax=unclassified Alteromonas TaxID=2614992 RepID=UPI00192320DB|nr:MULTISPECIES: S41 family peptidase [unclassified Alteromonas]BCO20591.1 hypothetical protein KUC3_34480 [Alteromonas sp. KC3]BCO24560.1 hypothetical protein KUC14_34290 [Alteromonas sp. KC14]